jgi:hypothetical protein
MQLQACVLATVALLSLAQASGRVQETRAAKVIRRHAAPEASQAVAVDARFFYAIGNAEIGKYDKKTGRRVGGFRGQKGGRVAHLNSGIVVGWTLFCAHSNYPDTPMVSSIEVFETGGMTHVRTIPLPGGHGSATWVEHAEGEWWVTFAHYAGKGGEAGKGPEATTLVQFDRGWRLVRAWSFPEQIVARWDGMSSSGGTWAGTRGLLYTTGHHAPELYLLDVPPSGRELTLRDIIPIESEGQGIALDREERLLYSIQRRTREVLVSELPPLSR